jgi:hypothetical protein
MDLCRVLSSRIPYISKIARDILEDCIVLLVMQMSCSALSLFCFYSCDERHLGMFDYPHLERKHPLVEERVALQCVIPHTNSGHSSHSQYRPEGRVGEVKREVKSVVWRDEIGERIHMDRHVKM